MNIVSTCIYHYAWIHHSSITENLMDYASWVSGLLHLQGGTVVHSKYRSLTWRPWNRFLWRPNLSYQASRRGQWLAPRKGGSSPLFQESKTRGTHGYTCPPNHKKKQLEKEQTISLKGSSFYQHFLEFMLESKGVDDEPDNLCILRPYDAWSETLKQLVLYIYIYKNKTRDNHIPTN